MGSWLPLPLRWRLVAPTLAVLAGAPGFAGAQDSSLARLIHRTQLDNGLDVITVENNTVPLATVLLAVRNGAFTQDSADQGMAHLYEHLLFRSNGDLKVERPVVLDELQRDESDPEHQLHRHVDRMLWGASWSRKDLSGDST